MFWKIVGGIALFFVVVALAVGVLAVAGVTAAGAIAGSVIDNLDIQTVEVTDAEGNTETYNVQELFAEGGRVEVTGDNGERVTVDLNGPRITVQESGEDASRVVLGGRSRVEINPDVPQIRIDGRSIDSFDGRFVVRPIVGFFAGMFKLAAWTLILVGVWLVLRNRKSATNLPVEKTPDATA